MKILRAYALLLGMVGIAASTDCSGESTGGDKAPGPTDLTVTWTFSGKPASADECMARMGTKVHVNLSGTYDPSLHQTVTEECATGTVKFANLDIEKLGTPYLEGALLNAKEMRVTQAGLTVMPTSGATNATIDFYPIPDGGAGGASSSSSSSSSSKAASSSSSSGSGSGSGSSGSGSGSSSSSGGSDAGADGA
jgi:hypothetical protein